MATKKLSDLKVAIVHDWLVGGGAEQVVQAISQVFPDAPIYTSYCTPEWRQRLEPAKVVTGYLQKWPFSRLRKFLPVLRHYWFRHLDLSGYDLVISSSGNGEAKAIRTKEGTVHVCYCHTPTHFYWRHYDQYVKQPGFGFMSPVVSLALKILVGPLRKWDYKSAQNPDFYLANSTHIKKDIKEYYGRDATVLHPPVDVDRFKESGKEPVRTGRHGFITVGRQVPYKKTEIIIQACNRLEQALLVIGRGPDNWRLKAMAGPKVTFLTKASDEDVAQHLAESKAFVFASFEDFGITPVEAMAAGTPVIAYKAGGSLDYVKPGVTGEFFAEQTIESLAEELQTFNADKYSEAKIKAFAQQFSKVNFTKELTAFLTKHVLH